MEYLQAKLALVVAGLNEGGSILGSPIGRCIAHAVHTHFEPSHHHGVLGANVLRWQADVNFPLRVQQLMPTVAC